MTHWNQLCTKAKSPKKSPKAHLASASIQKQNHKSPSSKRQARFLPRGLGQQKRHHTGIQHYPYLDLLEVCASGKPMETSHSFTSTHGNFERLLVFVCTTSPMLVSKTSEISSSASLVSPRLESRIARLMISSTEGFGSGNSHRFVSKQHNSSCSLRAPADMMPSFSAAYELDNIPYTTPTP